MRTHTRDIDRLVVHLLAAVLAVCSAATVVAQDPLVLYTFQEGSGDTVEDVSGVAPALDLVADEPGNLRWIVGGGLELTDPVLLASAGPATKVIEACMASQEISIVAWVKPSTLANTGPARIVTISGDPSNRNVTFGQDTTGYQVRLRTTVTGNNGVNPFLPAPNTVQTTDMAKLLYSPSADEQATFYIDGDEVATLAIAGLFDNWNIAYQIGIGHELNRADDLGRDYKGDYYLIAIYDVALTPDDLPDLLAVEPRDKLAVTWGSLKAE